MGVGYTIRIACVNTDLIKVKRRCPSKWRRRCISCNAIHNNRRARRGVYILVNCFACQLLFAPRCRTPVVLKLQSASSRNHRGRRCCISEVSSPEVIRLCMDTDSDRADGGTAPPAAGGTGSAGGRCRQCHCDRKRTRHRLVLDPWRRGGAEGIASRADRVSEPIIRRAG